MSVIQVKPNEVKMALTGYGKADKRQMQEMTKAVFGLTKIPKPDDAADALAIAWTAIGRARLS
jgi:crossover junction endodeoxyribonuclease RuvC